MGEQALNLACTVSAGANFKTVLKNIKCLKEKVVY